MSKTTGTIPMIIDVNNQEIKLKRLGPANIREQLRILRKAVKSGCDYLVIECMAVNPELQYICEHKMLHSDITVITNVRMDHLDVMGDNLKDISRSLSNTIPDNGILILGSEIDDNEEIFNVIKEENNKYHSEIFVSDKINYKSWNDLSSHDLSFPDLSFDELFNDNILTALKVCEVLGLDKEDFIKGMKQYKKDPGALEIIKRNDKTFINGFSINDPDSIMLVYDLLINKYNIDKNKLTILLNERGDRIFRTKQHIEMFKKIECEKVIISGDNVGYISKELGKIGIENKIIKRIDELDNYEIIFGKRWFALFIIISIILNIVII